MKIINVNADNIAKEHICCAISDKKGENCVAVKKEWMNNNFANGLVFKKFDIRGKAFIEYIPAEKAWYPVLAPNHLFINCFWISGQYKGRGLSNILLNECLEDAYAAGKDGLVILSSEKKRPYLADPAHLKHKGFEMCDSAFPYFSLMQYKIKKEAKASFAPWAKNGTIKEKGLQLYYTNQCPFSEKYALIAETLARENNKALKLIKFNSYQEAQKSPSPWTTYSLFADGLFVTNEILSQAKLLKLFSSR